MLATEGLFTVLFLLLITLFAAGVTLDVHGDRPRTRQPRIVGSRKPAVRERWVQEPLIENPRRGLVREEAR